MLRQIETLREQLRQLGEHADLVAAGGSNNNKEHIRNTQNRLKDMCAICDQEIDWINRGCKAEEEVNVEAVEQHHPLCSAVTSRASLTSPQREHPLNMSVRGQRTRYMQPNLRVNRTASNCIQVTWTISEKKLQNNNKSFTSPDFDLWQGGTFKLVLRSSGPHNMKGGFQACNGVGRVELKFCGVTEFAGNVHFRVAVGQNKEFQGLDH